MPGHASRGSAGPPAPASQTAGASGSSSAIWWTQLSAQVNQGLLHVQEHAKRATTQMHTAAQSWKLPDLSKGLGMKVDVDWLNPAMTGLKQQWQQLPEPVREVVPYAGVALMAGVSVQRLYSEQLQLSHQRYGHLRDDHALLQQQFKQLAAELEDINTRRTGAHLEIQMAEAVAKATTAAAAAAAAAASAATACTAHLPGSQHQQQYGYGFTPHGGSSSSSSNAAAWQEEAGLAPSAGDGSSSSSKQQRVLPFLPRFPPAAAAGAKTGGSGSN